MICLPRRAVFAGLVALLLLPLILWLTRGDWLTWMGNLLTVPVKEEQADAIVVLSGGGPLRASKGIDLYRQGIAPELWFTGDVALETLTTFTDAATAQEFAVKRGVPESAIRRLPTTSTWEDGQWIAQTARQVRARKVLVVTEWYHSRRALCAIRRAVSADGIQVFIITPRPASDFVSGWWRKEQSLVEVLAEYVKWVFYWTHYGIALWDC